jgi:tRNA uridine 5-carboxymethylaminomethyl modification enzyme
MKTGTPPRVDGRSVDYSLMEEQKGDKVPGRFSYITDDVLNDQMSCWITYTNPTVHDILRGAVNDSPLFNGQIESVGPRYCPSVEDKVHRFADKERHQIFLEPEGRRTVEMYVNGFSTSLPQNIQEEAIRLIPGFKDVKLFRPGYAIEYDYFYPTQLSHTLETKLVEGLYFAGQINGTTGYEEAGCQGLMAGINAVLKVQNREPFVLKRDEAYIGVLIDDLVTRGTEEPYRMFTSRAEYRILLRQDNADQRLTRKGFELGLADKSRIERLEAKLNSVQDLKGTLERTTLSKDLTNEFLNKVKENVIKEPVKAYRILQRPRVSLTDMKSLVPELSSFSEEVLEQVEIKAKYSGYIERERDNAEKLTRLENVNIPESFDFNQVKGMSTEARIKLTEIRPRTIGQAKRVSGVSPNDISVLLIFIGR